MKFIIKSAQSCFNEEGKKELEPLGFQFILGDDPKNPVYWIDDEKDVEIEVVDIEGLWALCLKYGPIIVRTGMLADDLPELLIYNDYIE